MNKSNLPKILVVDDDEQILKQIEWALGEDFQVFAAGDRATALGILKRERVPIVLLDLGLPPNPREASEGLLALEEMVAHDPLIKVIIVSGNSERHNALRAIEKGAHDIFPKPVDLDELKVVLRRVLRRIGLELESIEERNLTRSLPVEEIIGASPPMQAFFATVKKVAATDVPVLILGESGTGKEMVASAIHNLGARSKGPFIAINCAAIPANLLESELFGHERGSFTGATTLRRGKFEYANGGTLFLDEIGDLAPELQVKILRFLQERVIERVGGREPIRVDTRVIAATHHDLEAAVREDRFRDDLYFRLAVLKIALPPLRERGEDVIEIAEHIAAAAAKELRMPPKRFTKQAIEAMKQHSWPGNVRELQNRVKRAMVLADGPSITPAEMELELHRGTGSSQGTKLKEAKQELERELIVRTLRESGGNISQAARALGISRPTLYELMSRYGL
jgi:two-component system, NtrC family, response regulator